MPFSAFLYLWNLIVKKNKKFKTGLITLYVLLLITSYKGIEKYDFYLVLAETKLKGSFDDSDGDFQCNCSDCGGKTDTVPEACNRER